MGAREMKRIARTVCMAALLTLPLAACASISDFSIDPTEWFEGDWFGAKKKLPGERKPVFPEGVPGVTRGVPRDLVKGNQATDDVADIPAGGPGTEQAAVPQQEPKAKPKPKPKPKVAAKPAPVEGEPESRPTPVTIRRSDQPAGQQQQPAASGWPEAPPARQQQPAGGTQWPDPPAARGSTPSGGTQWPDPPPTR
jgi:hypothetical protein